MIDRDASRQAGKLVLAALGLGLLVLGLGGCGSSSQLIRTRLEPFGPEDLALREAAKNARYRLDVGDQFTVDFKYQDELDQHHIMILPDGHFTLSGLDDYLVGAGLSIPQLDSLLTVSFARDYLAPDLTVLVEEFGEMRVYVLGEVGRPGLVSVPPRGGGVLQAVALAGGFLPDAEKSQTVLIRVTPEGYLYRVCDLAHLEKRGLASAALLDLKPYDIVYVPRSTVGDLAYFSKNVLGSLVNLSQLFWDIYAIANVDKIDRIVR